MGNSSSTPSSTTTNGEQYDVFISFRGGDTRKGFTSHLYQALHEKQIKTFIDNQLKRGEEISEGLLSVIRESKISVVIFSENYASSKWCLRELEEIMKCWEMKKQIVIPVFYQVDPSHVRKQSGSYEAAFAKHENELQEEEVKKWRDALTQASNISGFDSSTERDESELVCEIVREVWNKLNHISPSCDFKELVGIEKHIEQLESLLCLEVPDFRIIGIWGMGGIGKTTIAKAVSQQVSHRFENMTYFTPSVRAESKNNLNGLNRLRDEILSKVLINESQISGRPDKRMLKQKKVLIVLDDVNKVTEWETLVDGLDDDGLAPGSRIILTARDLQVLRNCGVADHNLYKVEELNCDEALQLFCKYAFKQNHPTKDFEVLSKVVVKIATNLPLSVKVLGSLLYTKSKRDWENAVDKFQRNVNREVRDVLKISYDGLDEEEQGLFLDIACFVEFEFERLRFEINEDNFELENEFEINEDNFVPNLSSDRVFSLIGLVDKSLVTIEDRRIKMHDLLREMGREIVDKESPNKPGDRSRLWRRNDVLHMLKHNDGIDAVQGIFLSMLNLKDVCLSFQALTKMNNLTTLIIIGGYDYQCYNGLDYLPNKLRYLRWESYPLEVLPSSFNPENLVELDLSYSKIKQLWEGSTLVPKLKWLRLVYCMKLISIPDLSNIPSAEIINLEGCSSLTEIHSSRECLKNLHSLNLSLCRKLSSFPSNIHLSEEPSFSTSVVLHSSREGSEFSLSCCSRFTKFPHISGNIKRLNLRLSGVKEVPSTIESLSKLESLDMSDCRRLKSISESICKLKSLVRLDLSGCCKLKSFPDNLEGMELKYLDLSGTAIKELPPSIGNLNQLEELVLSDCKNLERLPKSIKDLSKLYSLYLNHCRMLRSLPELPSSLWHLEASYCKQLIQLLPDESEFDLCADGSGTLYFNFINSPKMNQKAVSNLLIFFRDSLQKMQRMGTEKINSLFERDYRKEVEGSICLPGSEIPKWFCYKNIGSSLHIPELQKDCGRSSYIMGFAVCLVVGISRRSRFFGGPRNVDYDIHIETSDGHKERFSHRFPRFEDNEFIYSDHILLGYNLSSKHYEFFQKLDTSFELNLHQHSDEYFFSSHSYFEKLLKGCKVKQCGIQPIYVQAHVMNSVVIDQDIGDTCKSNDTEETCELNLH